MKAKSKTLVCRFLVAAPWSIMFFCAVSPVRGDLLGLPQGGKPDIYSDNIQVTYNSVSGIFTAQGYAEYVVLTPGGSQTSNTMGMFYLNAVINNSTSHIVSQEANLDVTFGNSATPPAFFESGSLNTSNLTSVGSNSNFVAFALGTNETDFEFEQGSFGQTGSVPGSGSLIEVILHSGTADTGWGSGSTTPINMQEADTMVVTPLPSPAASLIALLGTLGLFRFAVYTRRKHQAITRTP